MREKLTVGSKLNNLQKVAAVLVSLGPETSATILRHLETSQVERIVRAIVHMKHLDPSLRLQVLEEFKQQCLSRPEPEREETGYGEKLFPKKPQAKASPREIEEEKDSLAMLGQAEVGEILALIKGEHPQIIALVLGRLPAEKAAAVLAGLPDNLRLQVAVRVAKSDINSASALHRLSEALRQKTAAAQPKPEAPSAGSQILAEILRNSGRGIEREVLKSLCRQDPGIAYYLQKQLLNFDSLGKLESGGLQLLLQEITSEDLLLALRGAGEETKQAVLQHLSEGRKKQVEAELAAAPPSRLREVEAAQMRIAALLREKVEAGLISFQLEEQGVVQNH
jgi:flagellar motor switch protein FliG